MRMRPIGRSGMVASGVAYGCARLARLDAGAAAAAIRAAFEAGCTLFDTADIYGDGRAEELLGAALRDVPELRRTALVATKAGIVREGSGFGVQGSGQAAGGDSDSAFCLLPCAFPLLPYRYDSSASHLVAACEGSLRRLGAEAIDLFQVHRPDLLMEAAEVAEAVERLKRGGKIRAFGVSNFAPWQVDLLLSAGVEVASNQVELSLGKRTAMEDGTAAQAAREGMALLAWSPLCGGTLAAAPADALAGTLDAVAAHRGVSRAAIALAWVARIPPGAIPILGSTDPHRIRAAAAAGDLELSRPEWYALLQAARGRRLD